MVNLFQLLELANENKNFIVKDSLNGEVIASYDGKNSIDQAFNGLKVLSLEAENDCLVAYVLFN